MAEQILHVSCWLDDENFQTCANYLFLYYINGRNNGYIRARFPALELKILVFDVIE